MKIINETIELEKAIKAKEAELKALRANLAGLKTSPDICEITVLFVRDVSKEEVKLLRENYKSGVNLTDPKTDLDGALVEQFVNELQDAYTEHGIGGNFTVQAIKRYKKRRT